MNMGELSQAQYRDLGISCIYIPLAIAFVLAGATSDQYDGRFNRFIDRHVGAIW
jgi:hypothetical protein